jgi:hypothetical protein
MIVNSHPAHQNALTYVDDAAERTNRVWSVDGICATTSILHDRTRNHNNILRRMRQLFDGKVHHLPKAGILILEELRDPEEQGRRFVGWETFAGV